MDTLIKVPQHLKKDVWAFIIVPISVAIIPYGIIWTFWPPEGTRHVLRDIRFWSLGLIAASWGLCWLKIFLHSIGFLRNKRNEKIVDLFLSLVIVGSALVLLVSYVPVLLVLLCVAHFAQPEDFTKRERWLTRVMLGLLVLFTLLLGWYYMAAGKFPLGLLVILSCCSTFVFLIAFSIFSKDKRISNAKLIIDRVIYVLSSVCTSVYGVPVIIKGKFQDDCYAIVSDHGGAVEYAGGVWPVVNGPHPCKILAGDNLDDFPIVGDFIKLKTITVKGRRRKREYKGILKIVVFIFRTIKSLPRLFSGKKEKKPVEEIKNIAVIRAIPETVKNKVRVWIPPKGRERLSDNGALKRIEPANLMFLDVVTPVLCLGTLQYKPANKKEKDGKKWYQQQFWLSPRYIRAYILDPVYRFEDELPDQYSERIWVIMTAAKTKFLKEIAEKEQRAKERLDAFFAKVLQPFKWLYCFMLSLFDEPYLGA